MARRGRLVRRDETPHPIRVHPRVGAERPSHRLLHEELVVPETRFQAVVQQRRIGALLQAELAEQGRPPAPDVPVARPGAHQGAHRPRLRDEDAPEPGRGDPVDVVPPRPVDDEVVEHGDRVHRHPAQKGPVHGEFYRRIALLAMPRFPPQGENRRPPRFGGGRGMPVEDGPCRLSHDWNPHPQERHRRLHVALLSGRALGLAHRPERVMHGGEELARGASSPRPGRFRHRHGCVGVGHGEPGMRWKKHGGRRSRARAGGRRSLRMGGVASTESIQPCRRIRPPTGRVPGAALYRASSSETQASRKRMKPLPSRLGAATQWPQGES